jgi:hypothetical protein
MSTDKVPKTRNIKELPSELKDFNWAAFLLTFIWGFKYNAWITFLAIPLIIFQMPLGFNWILLALLQLYCGFKGNEWAYKKDYWMKSKDFRITQMKWAVVALATYIIIPLIILSLSSKFFKKSDNLENLIQNTQCVIAYKNLKTDIKNTNININIDGVTLTRQIINKHNRDTENPNTIINKKNPTIAQTYDISVYKDSNKLCSIVNRNCKIIYSFYMPQYSSYTNECEFYFDNYKQVIPNEQTQNKINKGVNIFNYL